MNDDYPVRFSVEYPDRPLNRLTTGFRLFTVIAIAIVLATIGGYSATYGSAAETTTVAIGGTGLLFLPPLLMILFRQKYPRWWFDWNHELLRLTNRVGAYLVLLDDRYPSTDEQHSVRLDLDYPDAKEGLNRWLPLVMWLLAMVRDPLHRALSAWALRLHRGRDPLAQQGRGLRVHPHNRSLPAVPAASMRVVGTLFLIADGVDTSR